MAEQGNGIVGVSEVWGCIFGETRAHVLGEVTGAVDIALVCAAGGHFGKFEALHALELLLGLTGLFVRRW